MRAREAGETRARALARKWVSSAACMLKEAFAPRSAWPAAHVAEMYAACKTAHVAMACAALW